MIVGIVSDTHGHANRLRSAMEIFAARGVTTVVHCGDIGSVECLEMLSDLNVPAYAVGGNMDYRFDDMQRIADYAGVNFAWDSITIPLNGSKACLAVTHGHDQRALASLGKDANVKFLCHGHTHRQHDEHLGPLHVINPGALHSPRGPAYPTIAILDTDTDALEFVEVPK